AERTPRGGSSRCERVDAPRSNTDSQAGPAAVAALGADYLGISHTYPHGLSSLVRLTRRSRECMTRAASGGVPLSKEHRARDGVNEWFKRNHSTWTDLLGRRQSDASLPRRGRGHGA